MFFELTIRSSVVLAGGLALERLSGRWPAGLRHLMVAVTIFAAAAVYPLALTLPAWTISLPAAAVAAPAAAAPSTAAVSTTATGRQASPAPRGVETRWLWLAGVCVLCGWLLAGAVRLARIGDGAAPVEDVRWLQARDRVAEGYGLGRPVLLLQTATANLLATYGLRRPRVLLPWHAPSWPDDRVHAVLSHELAHIRRFDWPVQLGAELMRSLLWFNPLIWVASVRLRRLAEQACDDEVVGRGLNVNDYAQHLLDVARACRMPRASVPALWMVRQSAFERRIAVLLNSRLDRRTISWRPATAMAALLLVLTVPAAALHARQAGPDTLAGTVYDPTGGVMPGVTVSLVDASQTKKVAQTDASGRYEFPSVAPGQYVLTASEPGFRELRQEFSLASRQDWDRAITLQVGDLREQIHVTASRTAAGAASTPAAGPIRVGGNVRVPRKLRDVKPIYPASMVEAGREGVVPLEATIGVDGSVTSVRVLSADVHPDFAVAAIDAVRQWRFSPTLLNGAPVEVVMRVSVTFSLDQ